MGEDLSDDMPEHSVSEPVTFLGFGLFLLFASASVA